MEYQDEEKENRKARRQKRLLARKVWYHKTIIRIFAVVIVLFFVANLLVKDKTFSEQENRSLTQKPDLTLSSLTDGSYFTDLSSYLSDQFAGRDSWMSFRSLMQRASGQKESGDVYFGKEGHLLEKPVEADEEVVQNTEEAIKAFSESYSDLSLNLMLVPGAASVQTQYLPANAPVYDQLSDIDEIETALSESLTVLDVSSVMQSHASEYIYYKTDHHWTSRGAYFAFVSLAPSMGLTDTADSYDIYRVSDSFQGTLSSESGIHDTSDTIEIYQPTNVDNSYYVYYPDTGEKTASVYESAQLEEKDQYTLFTGGNHAVVEIRSTNLNGKNLLILKDSYANCFVQFLTPYYESIILVDPRYYYDNLATLINENNITDVLFLYSMNTIADNTSLADVLNACVTSHEEMIAVASASQTDTGEVSEQETTGQETSEEGTESVTADSTGS